MDGMILVRVKPSISLAIRQASEMGLIPFSMQRRNLSNKGGGGVYSYIRVMPDGFLLKSTQIQKKSVEQNMNL